MEPTKRMQVFGTSNSMGNIRRCSNNSIKQSDAVIAPSSTKVASSPPIYSLENYNNHDDDTGKRKKTLQGHYHEYRGGCLPSRSFGRVLQTSSAVGTSSSSLSAFMMRPNPHERLWHPSPSKKARSTTSSSSDRVVLGEKRIMEEHVVDVGVGEGGCDRMGWERSSSAKRTVNKENKSRSKYFPSITTGVNENKLSEENQQTYSDYIIPQLPQQSSSTDLNNSFTEKISNLDIGFGEPSARGSLCIQFGQQDQLKEETEEEVNYPLSSSSSLSLSDPITNMNKENSNVKKIKIRPVRTTAPPLSSRCSEFWHEHLDPTYPYITDILNYWHLLEMEHKVDSEYMGKQKEISFKMRTILVDWIVEVVEEFNLHCITLHRSVQFVDRFLSKLQISRSNLQLLGTACVLIASKVEEIHPPDSSDLIYITDNTYDKSQLLQMECLVLSALEFNLSSPSAYEFTEYFASVLYLNPTSHEFSIYAVSLSLLHERFLVFSPSIIAIAGVYCGMWCCGDSRHTCHQEGGRTAEELPRNNKTRSNKAHNNMTVLSVLSRVKRLNPNPAFVQCVEEAVSQMFVSILSVTSYNGHSSESNSVCAKYRKFQDQKYFRAATSAAACFSF